jgi:hypothetical protein
MWYLWHKGDSNLGILPYCKILPAQCADYKTAKCNHSKYKALFRCVASIISTNRSGAIPPLPALDQSIFDDSNWRIQFNDAITKLKATMLTEADLKNKTSLNIGGMDIYVRKWEELNQNLKTGNYFFSHELPLPVNENIL